MSPQKIKEIPEKCKFLKTCTRKVEEEHYEALCDSKSWIHCDWVTPKDYDVFLAKPSEWEKGGLKA